ncbi:hypothetical protein RN001_006385 [Aquatica leii]|uniref:Uncharacterized protein n=1 Tax=Aquatica leii TaxID=1421715 RepID=A0AAN7SBE3_9COLE|nr:hypothetical protein RN001_006385 [Aquatica leii]
MTNGRQFENLLNYQFNDYIYFWSGVDKDKRAKSGVIIAISRRLENSISNWNPISERILTVDLRIKGRDLRVFGIYAPTDDSDFNIKEEFFEKLLMTYGSETWAMDKNSEQKLLSAEMSYWRRCCGLTLQEHNTNENMELDPTSEKQKRQTKKETYYRSLLICTFSFDVPLKAN